MYYAIAAVICLLVGYVILSRTNKAVDKLRKKADELQAEIDLIQAAQIRRKASGILDTGAIIATVVLIAGAIFAYLALS